MSRTKYLLMALAILLGTSSTIIMAPHSVIASSWWNSSWSYRQEVTITETSGSDLADYQVKISLPYNTHMRSDFSDIRFIDSDDLTSLSYWRESYTASSSAIFWVKVPSIPSQAATKIYMYYGNPTADTASNIHNTFIWGDDFEDLNWTNTNLNPVNFWGSTQYIENGEYHMSGPATSEPIAEMYRSGSLMEFPLDYVAEGSFKPVLLAGGAFIAPRYIETENKYECWVDTEWSYVLFSVKLEGGWVMPAYAPLGYTVTAGTWYKLKTAVTREGDTNRLQIFVNDTMYINVTDSSLSYPGLAFLLYDWDEPFHMAVDNFRVRQYASSEPTISLGAEEPYGNRAPVASNDSYSTNQDTPLTVTAPGVLANDSDPDNDPLTAIKVTDPAQGTLTLNSSGGFTYTPAAGYSGSDSFTYKANDGKLDSNVATAAIIVNPSGIPVMYENYTSANANDVFYGSYWRAQSFTPSTAHVITKVRLPLIRVGNPSGDVIVSIRETDASGYPIGGDLASGRIACSSVSSAWAESWYDFDLGSGYPLAAGKQYAIVWRAPGADESNPLYFGMNMSGTYAGGRLMGSEGGTGWIDMGSRAWDAVFQDWGVGGTQINYPPVLSPIGNRTVVKGQLLEFTVSATDANNDPLTYSASNLPVGATFNAATHIFSWTPNTTGTFPGVHFEVSDGKLSDSEDITITVTETTPPVLYENYTSANANDVFYGTYWRAQSFTPSTAHVITKVRLPLIRVGNPSGDVIVSIRETDASGYPIGGDLASGRIACSSVSSAWVEFWYDFDLGSGYPLVAGKQYAIVWRAPGADESNPLYFGMNMSGTYAGGRLMGSEGGTGWIDMGSRAWDAVFQDWGVPGA